MNRNDISVSVAMAAYNGERYIKEQIESILSQLKASDELIVSLDPSTDRTEKILQEIGQRDARVHLIYGKGKGLIKNFENAIRHCKRDIIFLADQDDVWKADKVTSVLECFQNKKTMVVMHDAEIVDASMQCVCRSFMEKRGSRTGIFKNIIKNSYIGCCMAFRKEMKPYILPFPKRIPMHDQWIGLVGEMTGVNVMTRNVLISYRRHGDNVSAEHHSSIIQMLRWRVTLILNLCRFYRTYKSGKGRRTK